MKEKVILEVENLCVDFRTRNGTARVLSNLGFRLHHKENFGIAGESGCGKTMTALAIMGLIPSPQGRVSEGTILLNGEDLVRAGEKRLCAIRGREISMIFQEPMTSLNPVLSIGEQVMESLRYHEGLSRKESWDRAVEMLRLVGVPSPLQRAREYPHQMSGGMRQRVMIAIALACSPKILIADEPTTALDVTIQAQILDLLKEIQEQIKTAIILITHDVGVLAETTERMIVMYAGYKVEEGPTAQVLHSPKHPYTSSLIACIPKMHLNRRQERSLLPEMPGIVPDLTEPSHGCAFAPRCPVAVQECWIAIPPMLEMGADHFTSCWIL